MARSLAPGWAGLSQAWTLLLPPQPHPSEQARALPGCGLALTNFQCLSRLRTRRPVQHLAVQTWGSKHGMVA